VSGCAHSFFFVALAPNKATILLVFRFIIEYSSLRDFGPWVIGLFLYEDFLKMIFWLVFRLVIYLEIFWFLLEVFIMIICLHGEIFEFL
jgi:hypothetical protein